MGAVMPPPPPELAVDAVWIERAPGSAALRPPDAMAPSFPALRREPSSCLAAAADAASASTFAASLSTTRSTSSPTPRM